MQMSALAVVYPCLLCIYLGQGAYLVGNPGSYTSLYFSSLPTPVYWPLFCLATLAAIVASQSIVTGACRPQSPILAILANFHACNSGSSRRSPGAVSSLHACSRHADRLHQCRDGHVPVGCSLGVSGRLRCEMSALRCMTNGGCCAKTGTFSIISQSMTLNCFPRCRIVHTSASVRGQIYIPEVNWCGRSAAACVVPSAAA